MFFSLVKQATGPADRWFMVISALALITYAWVSQAGVGEAVTIHRNNQPIMTLTLEKESTTEVEGRLGPVKIEIKNGRARLLEYNSLRLIGTRTGWIQDQGEIAVCVPCGILIQIQGGANPASQNRGRPSYDGIAR
jgi:hypothetical protein